MKNLLKSVLLVSLAVLAVSCKNKASDENVYTLTNENGMSVKITPLAAV